MLACFHDIICPSKRAKYVLACFYDTICPSRKAKYLLAFLYDIIGMSFQKGKICVSALLYDRYHRSFKKGKPCVAFSYDAICTLQLRVKLKKRISSFVYFEGYRAISRS